MVRGLGVLGSHTHSWAPKVLLNANLCPRGMEAANMGVAFQVKAYKVYGLGRDLTWRFRVQAVQRP